MFVDYIVMFKQFPDNDISVVFLDALQMNAPEKILAGTNAILKLFIRDVHNPRIIIL